MCAHPSLSPTKETPKNDVGKGQENDHGNDGFSTSFRRSISIASASTTCMNCPTKKLKRLIKEHDSEELRNACEVVIAKLKRSEKKIKTLKIKLTEKMERERFLEEKISNALKEKLELEREKNKLQTKLKQVTWLEKSQTIIKEIEDELRLNDVEICLVCGYAQVWHKGKKCPHDQAPASKERSQEQRVRLGRWMWLIFDGDENTKDFRVINLKSNLLEAFRKIQEKDINELNNDESVLRIFSSNQQWGIAFCELVTNVAAIANTSTVGEVRSTRSIEQFFVDILITSFGKAKEDELV